MVLTSFNLKMDINKELCKKYSDSKRNFYTISNLLLQQYDIKNKI